MKNKNKKIFNCVYDLETTKYKIESYSILSYELLDGMQWEKIDEYKLEQIKYEKKFLSCCEKNKIVKRLPGALIGYTELEAKLKTDIILVETFGYLLGVNFSTENQKEIIKEAMTNVEYMKIHYPEIFLKNNCNYIHSSYRNMVWE